MILGHIGKIFPIIIGMERLQLLEYYSYAVAAVAIENIKKRTN